MQLHKEQPIGIFDSGVGGLTVVNAIRQVLPAEKIIYFGDTAHLPYGDKSSESIIYYSTHITRFLLENQCKTIVIACNTASAHAFATVKQLVERQAPEVEVINVIEPVVDYVTSKKQLKKIGVIGTKGTIQSGTYQKKIREKNTDIDVIALPTPLFVPMIEEGFVYDDISNAIIRAYLSDEKLQHIETLILGCTHYPIIKNQIRKFYDFRLNVLDSSQLVAAQLKKRLAAQQLLSTGDMVAATAHRFFISDYTRFFQKIAEMFFDDEVRLQHLNLWQNED